MRVAGVDGTKGGWVAVVLDDGRFSRDELISGIHDDFEALKDAEVVAIDIPIGFGPRRADGAARSFLKGAASTVFTTPSREVLEIPFGPGLGVSAQSHALGQRIIHVTELAQRDPRVYEVHPEVCFRAMNGGVPLRYRKKSAGGALERVALLADAGIHLERVSASAMAPLDDVLDAAAGAWSAARISAGEARTLPEMPDEIDGRQIAIWY